MTLDVEVRLKPADYPKKFTELSHCARYLVTFDEKDDDLDSSISDFVGLLSQEYHADVEKSAYSRVYLCIIDFLINPRHYNQIFARQDNGCLASIALIDSSSYPEFTNPTVEEVLSSYSYEEEGRKVVDLYVGHSMGSG